MARPLPSPAQLLTSPLLHRLSELGGAAGYAQHVTDGSAHHELRTLVRTGLVHRPFRATYCLPGTAPLLTAAARLGGHVDCVSAAALHGLELLTPPARPHLALPTRRGTSPRTRADLPDAVLHRAGLRATSAAVRGPVQPIAAALARMLVCQPRDDALVAIDCALRLGLTDVDAIRAELPATAPARCRGALSLADGRAGSLLETRARLALVDAGYTPRLQVRHADVGAVDLQVEHVVIECDGFAYHADRIAFRNDRPRDRILQARGFVVLRFTADELLLRPTVVVQVLDAVLAAPRLR